MNKLFGRIGAFFSGFRTDKSRFRKVRRDARKIIQLHKKFTKLKNDLDLQKNTGFVDEVRKDFIGMIDSLSKSLDLVIDEIRNENIVELHNMNELSYVRSETYAFESRASAPEDRDKWNALRQKCEAAIKDVHAKLVNSQQKLADIFARKEQQSYLGIVTLSEESLEQEMKKVSQMARSPIGKSKREYKKIKRFSSERVAPTPELYEKELTPFLKAEENIDKLEAEELVDAFQFLKYIVMHVMEMEQIYRELNIEGFPTPIGEIFMGKIEEAHKSVLEKVNLVLGQGRWLEEREHRLPQAA